MKPLQTLKAAFAFACFYLGGAVMGVLVLPFVAPFARDPLVRIRRRQRLVTRGFRWTLGLLRGLGIFDFDPARVDPSLPDRPVVIVANHPTTIDVVAVLSVYRDAVVVIKDKIWNDPLLRWLFRWLGHVHGGDGSLDSNLGVVAAVEERLAQGFSVVIFPEGTRSPVSSLAPMAKGAFAVATRTGADILPVVIRCDPPVLHREAPWYAFPDHPVRYRLAPQPLVSTRGSSTRKVQRDIVTGFENAIFAQVRSSEGGRSQDPAPSGTMPG